MYREPLTSHCRDGGLMKKIYLDYNATTPIHPEVAEFARLFLYELFGNPSSMHWAGREVRPYIEQARECIADMIHGGPEEIVFSSGGTEADNHAIKGVAFAHREKGNHIITTKVEHPGVLNACAYLEKCGFDVTYLPVDRYGVVAPDDVKRAIRKETILISVMLANNETGTLMPIKEIGAIAREAGVLFHSDMVQALGKIPIDVNDMQVDLGAFSGHKVYAPKGVGILYVREGIDLDNLIHGGHQEAGRRAGTENLVGIGAFGKACEVMHREMAVEAPRIERLRRKLLEGIMARVDDVQLNGHPEFRLPNTLNLSFGFVESESLLIGLDLAGVAVSSGSACSSGSPEPSHVLLAMDIEPEVCQGALRMSLGRGTTEDDIDYVLDVLPGIVARLRSMSPFYKQK